MANYQPPNVASIHRTHSQEVLSSPQRPIPGVSVKAIMDRFSQYGSKITAKFILPAAETKIQQEANGLLDDIFPSRSNLFDNFRIINQLTIANPDEAQDLTLVAAEDYVKKSLANRTVTTMGTATNDTRQDRLSYLVSTSRQLAYDKSHTDMPQTTTPSSTNILTATMNAVIPDGPPAKKKIKIQYKSRTTKNVNWKKVPVMKLISTTKATAKDMYLDMLFHQYPNFLLKYSTTRRESSDGSSQRITYVCKLSNTSTDWGQCKMRCTIENSQQNKCVTVTYQLSSQPDCLCGQYQPKQRGLSRSDINVVKKLVQTLPNIKPEEAKSEVMCFKMNSSSSPSNHQDRARQKVQITCRFNHERKLSRRNDTIATRIIRVRDLVSVKERYTFHLPSTATKDCKREENIQKLGVALMDKNLLNISLLMVLQRVNR